MNQQQALQQYALQQQYLQAMGITSWLPTGPLPGAANRVQWRRQSQATTAMQSLGAATDTAGTDRASADRVNIDRAAANASAANPDTLNPGGAGTAAPPVAYTDTDTGNTAVAGSARPPAARSSRASDILAQASVPVTTASDSGRPSPAAGAVKSSQALNRGEEQVAASPATAQKSRLPAPRFRLLLAAYGDCLVISDMPLQASQGHMHNSGDSHYRLLANILQSIDLGGGEAHLHTFDWPFINSDHIDQGPDVARDGLADVMQRMPSAANVPLLLLGERATEFVLPEATEVPAGPFPMPQRTEQRTVLAGPSLHALMGVPGMKRELWQQLQALRRLLDAG